MELNFDTLAIPEDGGAITGRINFNGVFETDLVIHLASSDPSAVSFPAMVTVAAGEAFGAFDIIAIDNSIVDGTRPVTITASAEGIASHSITLALMDDEVAGFTVTEADGGMIVSEGGTSDTFTVALTTQPTGDVVLTVSRQTRTKQWSRLPR